MKAAILHEAGGPLVVEEVDRPIAGTGEVVVRVRACGLGLTIVWNRNGRHRARLPRIIGHEIAGEVAEVGPGVDRFAVGDRVAVYYYLTCGSCRWCVAGRPNLCRVRTGRVGRETDGGLAEFVRLPVTNVVRIPPGIDFADAAVATDAIATALHVLTARARVEAGETVLVVGGGGGVGVHMVAIARLLGARVIAVDIGPAKLALATEAGADAVIDAGSSSFDEEVERLTGGSGADVVVEMVGRNETLARSASSLGPGGRLVLVGTYDRDATLAVSHGTLQGEAAILGSSYCTPAEFATAIDLVAQGRIRAFVTRRVSLDAADATLRAVERMELPGRAAVVFP